MVSEPRLKVEVRGASEFRVCGRLCERVNWVVAQWCRHRGRTAPPSCEVTVCEAPEQHMGLGSGTQLAMAVVSGLDRIVGHQTAPAGDLAAAADRSRRSSVGTYGFLQGGLIVELGKESTEPVGKLFCRCSFPDRWRWLLIRPERLPPAIFGTEEQAAFARVPHVPQEVRSRLAHLACEELVPAAKQAEFGRFSDALYEYGYLSGSCFSECQGGPYRGELLTRIVRQVRARGVMGVGQSSWGPTLFALLPDQDAAEELAADLNVWSAAEPLVIRITTADNQGAAVTKEGADESPPVY